ncbi:MAG: ABC transporter ATP-binding protein [Clostridia bacterium]|nr:ABC transporter ATP-binding protein [Clostridia bacterium]
MTEERERRLQQKYAGLSSRAPAKKEFSIGGGRAGAMAAQGKPKDTKQTVKKLVWYLSREWALIIVALVCLLATTVGNLAATYMLRPIINEGISQYIGNVDEGMRVLTLRVIGLLTLYVCVRTMHFIHKRVMLTASQRSLNRLRRDLYEKLQKLPVRYFDTHSTGDLMSRFTNDVDTIGDMVNTTLVAMISGVITLVGTVILMIVTNFWLAMITIAFTPLLTFVSKTILKKSRPLFSKRQRALGALNGFSEEVISGQKVVKIFGREDATEEEFEYLNQQLCKAQISAQTRSILMGPINHNICNFAYAITACVGGIMVVTNGFDIGGLTVSLDYTRKFNQPINEISTQINVVFSALAGAERIFEVMDADEEVETARLSNVKELRGHVTLEHVHFGYVPDVPVLHDITLTAKPGQKIAFVGSTGAGKTTVTNLLSRFYEIEQGQIFIDGIPIEQIPRPVLRSHVAMVLQDIHLFTGTVRENIRYGRLDATDEEVEAAAKAVSAHDFIIHLEKGYDTLLEHDGANLSQGQRQLLNIARAAVSHAPILVLDEATSSVDTRTERNIEIGMDALMENRTTFVIAHRLSTVRKADRIMVLERGHIIESGNHQELLALGGRYSDLYHEIAKLD